MRGFVARQLRAVAKRVDRPDSARLPPFPPTLSESELDYRNMTALSLLDPDIHGFVLLALRGTGDDNRIDLEGYVPQLWWPALRDTMARMIEESYDYRRPVPSRR